LGEIGRGLLVWAAPNSLEIIVPHIPLLVNRSVEIGGVVGLGIQLPEGRGASLVLVSRAGDLLARSAFKNGRIITRSGVVKV
jgi:hypothetical protein